MLRPARRHVSVAVVAMAAALAPLLLGACSTLLPASRDEVVSAWTSYEHARAELAALRPFEAIRADVHRSGLDPQTQAAVTVLHFGDVLQRFAAAALIQPDDVDRGIQVCLHAGRQCTGYAIMVKKQQRQRVGSFWLDSLGFRRETLTTGWSVSALLVFVEDRLVYLLVGGQPTIQEVEIQRRPLGPLQGWGDHVVPAPR